MTTTKMFDPSNGRAHVPRTAEPQIQRGGGRRSSIISAALELFAVEGFRNTTMADIGERVGIRGPSIYGHFSSKQQLLSEIMSATMERLIGGFGLAVGTTEDVVERFRRAVEAHVRYHARHQFEAFVGTREIGNLHEPKRSAIAGLRDEYERGFRELIDQGSAESRFTVPSARLASYAILDMGMGVAVWFREDGPLREDQVVSEYGTMALKIVGAS